jgi:hypothetical protein
MSVKKAETFEVDSTAELTNVLARFKEYRTVIDPGSSMFSGFATIRKVDVLHELKIIELIGE